MGLEVVVINLDKHYDRYVKLEEALNSYGWTSRRFSAVYGKDVRNEYDAWIVPWVKPFIPRGVLGCALSHKIAMKQFLERNESDYMLLLEDDAVMDPNVVANFNLVINALPPQWDVVKFFGYPSHKTGPLLQKRRVMVDCCAQLIRRSGAKKLTDQKIGYPFYSDTCQWFVPGLEMYTVRSDVKTFYQTFDDTSINTMRYPQRDLNLPIVRLGELELVSGDIAVAIVLVVLYANRAKLIRYANRFRR
jgi:hypothetical protein